ncbi:permease-like cell division protein FtsX [Geopsychrobacter electrodiphilus]|uniref:permease-like cell division protein FtsX n=1 Tax=Geopsychrobacter electrodiphilus TaxID=225196 RepID=UPI000373D011|nr:permease-like cell division protein FtsX [Geopsychrobacter electrodiphilus]
MLEKIRYFILRALRNMRQWPVLCTAAILTMAVALATMATFFLVVLNIQGLATRWSKEVQVVAYFDAPPARDLIAPLTSKIENLPDVKQVVFVSQAEALKRFESRLGDDASLLEGVSQNVLPASLEVTLKEGSHTREGVARVVAELKKDKRFNDLQFGQEWLERFENFVDLLKFVGLILGSFFMFAALFIVSNTIKLTLYARRDELEIMALVGATKRFIQIPFLLEGAMQGFASGLLALGFLGLSYKLLLQKSLQSFWLTPIGFDPVFLSGDQQLILVVCGVFLGLLGSLASLRKFVRL